jgi:Tfp pilus assembly protein PilW
MRRLRVAGRPDDAGVTLAELLIYMVLLALVVTITGVIYVRTLVTQRDVQARAYASNQGQVVMTSIEGTLRNAVKVSTPSAFSGRLLLAQTRIGDADTDASFECVGWLFDPTTGSLRKVESPPGPTAATRGLTLASSFSAWQTMLTNATVTTIAGADQPVFSPEGATGARIRFDITNTRGGQPTTFESAAIPRTYTVPSGVSSCF